MDFVRRCSCLDRQFQERASEVKLNMMHLKKKTLIDAKWFDGEAQSRKVKNGTNLAFRQLPNGTCQTHPHTIPTPSHPPPYTLTNHGSGPWMIERSSQISS